MERVINPTCKGMNMNKIIGGSKGLTAFARDFMVENPNACVVERLLEMAGLRTWSGPRAEHLLVKTKHCRETLPGHGEAVRVEAWTDPETGLLYVTAELAGF